LAPEYNLDIQARIPVALSAIHNFIRTYEPGEEALLESPDILTNDNFGEAPVVGIVEQEADVRRDNIAKQMWDDYLRVCEERRIIDMNEDGKGDDGEDDEERDCLDESNND
jgi:hypothetical protein